MAYPGPSLEEKQRWMRERHSPPGAPASIAPTCFDERHYTPQQLAGMWGLSVDLTRRLFHHKPGVLVIGNPTGRAGKRSYTTIRIPQSVAARVYRRLQRV